MGDVIETAEMLDWCFFCPENADLILFHMFINLKETFVNRLEKKSVGLCLQTCNTSHKGKLVLVLIA